MVDIRVDKIIASGWDNITKEDLEFLYFEREMTKNNIAQLFNISYNQVRYKLKKFELNLQRKYIADSFKEALHNVKKQSLQELIFADEISHEKFENSELSWGPVKVLQGRYKGRIGYLDDDDGTYGYVYWGEMILSLDSNSRISLKYLSNDITTYDLARRADELKNKIALMRAGSHESRSKELYRNITDLYGEYTYIIGLLNRIYEATFYQNNGNNKRVFLSYSSFNKEMATWVATDLKMAGFQVWFDNWEIEGGHNIIDEIGKGIEKADALVMLVSKSYINSIMCKAEWNSYFMTKFKNQPNSIIPIILDDTIPPTILSSIRYLKISENFDYDSMMKDLKRALAKL